MGVAARQGRAVHFDAASLGAAMNHEFPILDGELEIRARGGARILRGKFPYEKTATIRSAGRVRKERFKRGSMSWQVEEFEKLQDELAGAIKQGIDAARIEALEDQIERRNTHLLIGHDYNRAVADMRTGNLICALRN